jgi:hypothetical protein
MVVVHLRPGIPSDEVIDLFDGDGASETSEPSVR